MSSSSQVKIQDGLHPDTTIKISYWDIENGNGNHDNSPMFITGYWSTRGLGSPIRMMLSAAQVNHWVVLYDVVEDDNDHNNKTKNPTGWSRDAWYREREWIERFHNLPNIPYLIDCRYNTIIVQTNAILSYLGRELNMMNGQKSIDMCRCEELLCEIMDLRDTIVNFAYDKNLEKAQEDAEQLVQGLASTVMDRLEKHLVSSCHDDCDTMDDDLSHVTHLVGDSFSAPDFALWEIMDQFHELCLYYGLPQMTKNRPYLEAFYKNFAMLPENRPFLEFPMLHSGLPMNNPYTRFGSDIDTKGPFERNKSKTTWRKQDIIELVRTKIPPNTKVSTSPK